MSSPSTPLKENKHDNNPHVVLNWLRRHFLVMLFCFTYFSCEYFIRGFAGATMVVWFGRMALLPFFLLYMDGWPVGMALIPFAILSILVLGLKPLRNIIVSWIVIFIMSWGMFSSTSKVSEQITRSNADKIFSALEEYKKDKGTYPDSLKQLTPKHIKYLPRPAFIGSGFEYSGHKNSFILEYIAAGDGMNKHIYGSKSKDWTYFDF